MIILTSNILPESAPDLYLHWGCIYIFRPLSYPLRSLIITTCSSIYYSILCHFMQEQRYANYKNNFTKSKFKKNGFKSVIHIFLKLWRSPIGERLEAQLIGIESCTEMRWEIIASFKQFQCRLNHFVAELAWYLAAQLCVLSQYSLNHFRSSASL